MLLKDVKSILTSIKEKAIGHDDEAAHSLEDSLFEAVLREVANGNSESQKLAKEALKSLKIEFSRWCA